MKFLFIDTETTGLDVAPDNHEVIEFCFIIEDETGRVIDRGTYKVLPARIDLAHPKALEVNGYNSENWKDALTKTEAAKIIAEKLCQRGMPVGHNVQFDIKALNALLKEGGIEEPYLAHRAMDTQALAIEPLMPTGLHSVSLDNCRRYLGWPLENAHAAEKDTEDCRRLFHTLNQATRLKRLWWGFVGSRNMKKKINTS